MDFDHIINKYLDDSATEDEKVILLEWLEESEDNRQIFRKTYDLWLYTHAVLASDVEVENALKLFNERIAASTRKKTGRSHTVRLYMMRIAATVLLLLSAGYIGYTIKGKGDVVITMNKLLTGAEGKGQYTLPDGSSVWLNANSVLEYPEAFTEGQRLVRLEGEALFDVKKDTRKPFIVQAGEMDIEVRGTVFLVSNYASKRKLETLLVEGSVEVKGDILSEPCVLSPGELFSYDKEKFHADLHKVNTSDYTNWINSKLIFDRSTLAEIMINLEKWYGIEMAASPELAENTRMSFTVRRESLEEVLKYMTITSPITYHWEDDILYFSSR